jgi:hypothetical protein
MNEPGMVIPPPYDDPRNWPFEWCEYDDARGFCTRLWTECSAAEAKAIAAEFGVCTRTISRAVRWFCLSVGQYDPKAWKAYKSRRKKERGERFLARMEARDQETKRVNAEVLEARSRSQSEREARERAEARGIQTDPSHSENSTGRSRAERQRRLNAKTRRNAGF